MSHPVIMTFGVVTAAAMLLSVNTSARRAWRLGLLLSVFAVGVLLWRGGAERLFAALLFSPLPPLAAALVGYARQSIHHLESYARRADDESLAEADSIRRETVQTRKRTETTRGQAETYRHLNGLSYRYGLCRDAQEVRKEIVEGGRRILRTEDVRILAFDALGHDPVPAGMESLQDVVLPVHRRLKDGRHAIAVALSTGALRPGRREVLAAIRGEPWANLDLRLLYSLSEVSTVALQAALFAEQIELEAMHDGLTGLLTRMAFEKIAQKEIALSLRAHRSFALAILDIDRFKPVNDTYGHEAGDEVLRALGREISTFLSDRAPETGKIEAGRYGGEEFVCVMPGQSAPVLAEELNRLRRKVAETLKRPDGEPLRFSAGVCEYPIDGENLDALYMSADKALYHAKATGRDNVRVFAR